MKDNQALQRALFYESQYRTAIVSDAVSFFDVNVTKNLIESDFFIKDELGNGFLSIPTYLGLETPCLFTVAMERWINSMVSEPNQIMISDIEDIDRKILELFNNGKREYAFNYWGKDFSGNNVFYNQRFLITQNEIGEVCALSILKDLTTLKEYDDSFVTSELKKIAYVDPLTGGNNFQKFKSDIEGGQIAGSIICFDIKSFKTINSLCGIEKGDEIIKLLWNCIFKSIADEKGERAAHVIADHFILFYPTFDTDEIITKLKTLSLSILAASIDFEIPQITPYYGISKWYPDKSIELSYNEAIIAKNNANLESLKNYGFYSERDTEILKKEHKILKSFDDAISKKEFKIWFQPKYSPGSDFLCGAEALVRWIKSDGTIIPPSDFIPIFERNNKIKELDEYIFRNVCLFQKEMKDKNITVVPVSVNLSRASLYYNGIVDRYKTIIEKIGIDTKIVPIEITETAAITNNQISNIAHLFHEAGFSLQMDDFGSGYSSLSTLNTMYFDTIKIDKSLVDYIGTYNGDKLLEHTINLAKDLGIRITAEGVELQEQVEFLKKHGCDNIQGFYYSKPVNSDEFKKILIEKKILKQEKTETQLINNYLLNFIHGFEARKAFFYIYNLNEKRIIERKSIDGKIETSGFSYDDLEQDMKKIVSLVFDKNDKEFFSHVCDIEQILTDYNEKCTTRNYTFPIIRNQKREEWSIVRHAFTISGSSSIYCYLKFYINED